MPIQITTQPAILSWNSQNAQLSQSGNGMQTLELQVNKPQLEMETTQPKVLIDQSQPFAEAGLKNIKAFMDESISYGLQIVQQGIARIVDQGNSYIEIHSGVDPIPDQAISNAFDMFDKEFNYGAIPKSRPSIRLQEGRVNTSFVPGSVNNNSTQRKVELEYTPWQVNYFMKQYSSVDIMLQPSNLKYSV